MDAVLVYITAADREEAISIAHELVNERLIACANIVENATSIYRWQGEITRDAETLIVAKTLGSHVERVVARVKELHSYDCPCVVAMPIADGNPEYLAWIEKEVKG